MSKQLRIIALSLCAIVCASTVHAQSSQTSLIHYWNFNNLGGPDSMPAVPNIKADYSLLDTNRAFLEYYLIPGTSNVYAGYIDNVSGGDTANLRNGAPAGLALRVRNPVDSIQLRWHIPSTGYQNLVVNFVVESSSPTSGDSTQVYSYSVDGGTTWKTTGMTVNGANVDTMDVADNAMMQGANWGLVTVTFGSDLTVNDNANLIFRIIGRGNTSLLKGNNRYDDFTLDGVALGGSKPPPASIAMKTPATGNILVPGRHATISFTTLNQVGAVRTIEFSSNGGAAWSSVGTVNEATTYDWVVPNTATSNGMIRVTDSASVTATSGSFTIYPITSANRTVHYWNFNSFTGSYNNPAIPPLVADLSADGGHIGSIVYVREPGTSNTYAGYIDNVPGDTVNAHLGSGAGQGLRVRNPTDSMELRFVIPTNGYKGIALHYALQSSGAASAPQVEHFDYSVDGGLNWKTTGLTVNGVASTTLDVTLPQYVETVGYGPVSIGFGSETSMDDNANFIFRIKFGDTSAHHTSGNNRLDNVSVDAATRTPAGVDVPSLTASVNIAPNPATDYISFDNPFASSVTISVLDLLGREVLRSSDVASAHADLNTSTLPAGAYLLRFHAANGATSDARFVKQ